MAQFDVYRSTRTPRIPLLVDIQADFLSRLVTRVVVPLTPLGKFGARPITRLHPVVVVGDDDYVLLASELAAVPASALRTKAGSLVADRAKVIAALDLLFTGS